MQYGEQVARLTRANGLVEEAKKKVSVGLPLLLSLVPSLCAISPGAALHYGEQVTRLTLQWLRRGAKKKVRERGNSLCLCLSSPICEVWRAGGETDSRQWVGGGQQAWSLYLSLSLCP